MLTTIYMEFKQNPICGEKGCMGYLLDHPTLKGWLKCITCSYCVKVAERIIKVLKYEKRSN